MAGGAGIDRMEEWVLAYGSHRSQIPVVEVWSGWGEGGMTNGDIFGENKVGEVQMIDHSPPP